MKDFINNELKIGDYVAFARNPYADLMIGKVVGFTPKGIKITRKYKDGSWGGSQFYDKDYEIIYPYQCVRINYDVEKTSRTQQEKIVDNAVLIQINGKNFKCKCGGNVFSKTNKENYICNSCGESYAGE